MANPQSLLGSEGALPMTVLVEITGYLSLFDTRRLLMTCRTLHSAAAEIESKLEVVVITATTSQAEVSALLPIYNCFRDSIVGGEVLRDANFLYLSLWKNLTKLVHLDLGERASDHLFGILKHAAPALRHLSMVGSEAVTSEGFSDLGNALAAQMPEQAMRYVDITFCPNISYEVTMELRQQSKLHPDAIIRRQPVWMDGRFETPFQNDGVHTYWADGSFVYERSPPSIGYVKSYLRRSNNDANHDRNFLNNHHVATKLQFSNFDPPQGWPRWARFLYRPGVSLLHLPNEKDENDRKLLVAQSMKGMLPPRRWPKPEHSSLQVGVTKYFSSAGRMLKEEDERAIAAVMVTPMRVRALPPGGLMPPAEVLDRNRNFMRDKFASLSTGEIPFANEKSGERALHEMLGGFEGPEGIII